MKRASLLVGFALFALVVLSQSGAQATNNTFLERFSGPDVKKQGTTGRRYYQIVGGIYCPG